ncbi:MAG TPA: 6-bladed beta-propeller [Longimicrobiales bacterium]|nr:6-bladed beta-propeller [Longimicrobiales bacterium]
MRLGSVDAAQEQQFSRIRGAVRLQDGTIAVADGASQEIRFFTAEGAFAGAAGGRGSGPGEFRMLGSIRRTQNDSVIAWDIVARRVSVYGPTGTLLREQTLDELAGGLEFLGRLGDRAMMFAPQARSTPSGTAGVHRASRPFILVRDGGTRIDTITILPGFEHEVVLGDRVTSFEIPYARHAFGAAAGDRVYIGSNDRFEIQQRDASGTLVRLIRYPGGEQPLREQDVLALEREVISYVDPAPDRLRSIQRLFREVPQPELLPAFSAMLVDAEDNLWVASWVSAFAPPQRAPAEWYVFAADGHLLGRVDMPAGFRPLDVGTDYVLGVTRDDLEVEQIELYRLHRQAR